MSGVGTLTWLTFLPFALGIGVVSDRAGVHAAGWMLVVVAAGAIPLIFLVVRGHPSDRVIEPLPPSFPTERFLPADDPEWPGHWATPPSSWEGAPGLLSREAGILAEASKAIADLPSPQRDAIVLRDVEGRSPAEVQAALEVDAERERGLLNQARGQVRAHLERYLEEGNT